MTDNQATELKQEDVHTLLVPIELKNKAGEVTECITELTFKRLQGAAARKLLNAKDKGTGEFIAALISACARIPPSTVDLLDAADFVKASDIASDFFGVSLPT
jgi:hypothetical protein